jgi:hypothetical protein
MPISEVVRIATSAGCALVPVVPTLRWSAPPHQRRSRADPSFVTQLIASGELIPQTCAVQRATSTAYRSKPDDSNGLTDPAQCLNDVAARLP